MSPQHRSNVNGPKVGQQHLKSRTLLAQTHPRHGTRSVANTISRHRNWLVSGVDRGQCGGDDRRVLDTGQVARHWRCTAVQVGEREGVDLIVFLINFVEPNLVFILFINVVEPWETKIHVSISQVKLDRFIGWKLHNLFFSPEVNKGSCHHASICFSFYLICVCWITAIQVQSFCDVF